MNSNTHLKFLSNISVKKPNTIIRKETICPFCHRKNLKDILAEDGVFIWLKNKYATLENTLQTVIIETDNCQDNMSTYDKAHMRKLLQFAVSHWLNMKKNDEFKSVILFKNHGPYSGGSIAHSHLQIIGLKDIDYKDNLKDEFFEGLTINEADGCVVNISSKPMASFTEFNIIIDTLDNLNIMADNIQKIVHYILHNFHFKCDSFNLFFYEWRGSIICKAVPRFITSPLFIGFSIGQISNQQEKIVDQIQQLYFQDTTN